jgi:DHA3 family tetracycline resistance protein-like MFS transporter
LKQLRPYTVYLIYSTVMAFVRYMHFIAAAVYYVRVVGLSPFQLVLVGTTLMVVIMLSEVPTGVLADTYSRRLSVIIGVALMGAGFILGGAIANFAVILAAQVVWGVGATCTSGALEAWIADELGGRNLDAVYLGGAQIGYAGALAGIAGSVALASLRLNLPLVVSGAIGVALAAFLAFAMPEHGFAPKPRGEGTAWRVAVQTLHDGGRLVRGRTMLLMMMGITVFTAWRARASTGFGRFTFSPWLRFRPRPVSHRLPGSASSTPARCCSASARPGRRGTGSTRGVIVGCPVCWRGSQGWCWPACSASGWRERSGWRWWRTCWST